MPLGERVLTNDGAKEGHSS